MLTPAAKRRRRAAEVATATLTRPFRSPVIRGGRDGRAATQAASPERLHKRRQDSARSPSKEGEAAAAPQERSKASAEESEEQTPQQDTAAPSSLAELVQDFLVDLDAGDRSLAAAARAGAENQPSPTVAGNDNDGDNDDDDELPALIARWREAARMAADEVFSQVAGRVAHAGGVKAWRAMMRGDGWGADSAGERGDDRMQRRGREDDGEDEREDEREDRDPKHEDDSNGEEEEDHTEFTMSMMLTSLRVEPGLLGYNEAEERWED